ncbi:hypothetical protein ACCS81_38990, partial [Rhizobium ruizarguesonis]
VLPNHSESYQLPLAVAWDYAHPSALAQQLALGRIRQGSTTSNSPRTTPSANGIGVAEISRAA